MKPQDLLKMFVKEVGALIDARAKTTETLLKAEIKASEMRVKAELREEFKQTIAELKAELRGEIKTSEEKIIKVIGKKVIEHEERIKSLEDNPQYKN